MRVTAEVQCTTGDVETKKTQATRLRSWIIGAGWSKYRTAAEEAVAQADRFFVLVQAK